MVDLKQIFESRISIAPKVRTISGVFIDIDENLEHTNYEPSYQRNYVWDDEKASYFIESIFLGTEVPPIILFKSNDKEGRVYYEVIDGRQRYQTILRFINNELKLKKGGLQKLDGLKEFVGKNFSELPSKYQMLFVDTKIRLIEYQFINNSYSKEEEDAVKTEIFQRYNSGITPLKTYEIDKAQYYYNDLNQSIKDLLIDDHALDLSVTKLFRLDKSNLDQKAIKIRELLVLHRIPIKYYSIQKQKVISRYFESLSTQLDNDDIEDLFSSFRCKIDKLIVVKSSIDEAGIAYNRLYAECLFWALSVLEDNNIIDNVTESSQLARLIAFLKENESAFTTVKSSFAKVLVGRYEAVSKFFSQEYQCSFKLAIDNNPTFKAENFRLNSKGAVTVESQSFEELRINKPEPTSMELTELLSKLKNNRFLLRPGRFHIYRGILTGYNDAFIITTQKRDEILDACGSEDERKRTAEIIRPILRGRDIHRYGCEWANLWVIATFPARHYDIDEYPSLKSYLLSVGIEKLEQTGEEHIINGQKVKARKKTNNKWFETQDSISYWDDLSKPKIIWGEISDKSKFYFDNDGQYCPEATTFLMTGNDLSFLLAFLNCRLSEYLFSKIGTTTGVGTVRWKKFKIEQLPVPQTLPKETVDSIISLAEFASTQQAMGQQSYETESIIDQKIYASFGLTPEEIQFIEEQ